jgi:hypothetical protein
MKAIRLSILAGAILTAGTFWYFHANAQTARRKPSTSFERLMQLHSDLSKLEKTNIVRKFEEYVIAYEVDEQTHRIAYDARLLRLIRSGKITNALEYLERDLDEGCVNLQEFTTISTNDASELKEEHLRRLRVAQLYRESFPRRTDDAETDRTVRLMLDHTIGK